MESGKKAFFYLVQIVSGNVAIFSLDLGNEWENAEMYSVIAHFLFVSFFLSIFLSAWRIRRADDRRGVNSGLWVFLGFVNNKGFCIAPRL